MKFKSLVLTLAVCAGSFAMAQQTTINPQLISALKGGIRTQTGNLNTAFLEAAVNPTKTQVVIGNFAVDVSSGASDLASKLETTVSALLEKAEKEQNVKAQDVAQKMVKALQDGVKKLEAVDRADFAEKYYALVKSIFEQVADKSKWEAFVNRKDCF